MFRRLFKALLITSTSIVIYKKREILFTTTDYIEGHIDPEYRYPVNIIDKNRSYISLITATPPGVTFRDLLRNPFGHSCIGIGLTKPVNIKNTFGNVKVYANENVSQNFMINVTPIHNTDIGIKNPIHIITRDKYLYESNINENDQGGIFNRTFYEIRFYIDEQCIYRLINYFVDLYNKMETKEVKFSLHGHLKIYKKYNDRKNEGNCAYWISKGLQIAEIVDSHSYYPGVLFLKVLKNIKSDCKIIKYEASMYDKSIAGDGLIYTPFIPIFIKLSNKNKPLIDYTVRPRYIKDKSYDLFIQSKDN